MIDLKNAANVLKKRRAPTIVTATFESMLVPVHLRIVGRPFFDSIVRILFTYKHVRSVCSLWMCGGEKSERILSIREFWYDESSLIFFSEEKVNDFHLFQILFRSTINRWICELIITTSHCIENAFLRRIFDQDDQRYQQMWETERNTSNSIFYFFSISEISIQDPIQTTHLISHHQVDVQLTTNQSRTTENKSFLDVNQVRLESMRKIDFFFDFRNSSDFCSTDYRSQMGIALLFRSSHCNIGSFCCLCFETYESRFPTINDDKNFIVSFSSKRWRYRLCLLQTGGFSFCD